MPPTDLLTAERIVMLVEPGSRNAVLDAAARLLTDASPTHTAMIGEGLRERENIGTTAIGHGVALPHTRSGAYEQARGAFLRLEHPIDFNAADGKPVDLVFAMSVPEHSNDEHLRIIGALADRFADAPFRAALRSAPDINALRVLLYDSIQIW
ncbi:MAG: PTS sugar transporter subunit IIA [Luteimonas sp.]